MTQRQRKFTGAVVMISFVIFYALMAMALSQARVLQEANGLIQGLAYAFLGLFWIVPLMPLIKWMERKDA